VNEAIRVCLISLGCARNLVDSEVLLGHAAREGLLVARDPQDADVVVVNTCGFIESAKQESIDTILSVCRLKGEGSLKGVIAVGCLAQRYADELQCEVPELDAVLGLSDYSGVPGVIRRIVNGSERRFLATVDGGGPKLARSDLGRLLLTPRSYSYLRISEGCDHACTFCAIPAMRGRNRSKPIDVLVEEAHELAAAGVRELVIVAEDSTAYGLDLAREHLLPDLLERLGEVPGIRWIRVMYAYPHTVKPELTRVLREHPKLVPYLDIPIQHVSSAMLRAMKRGVSAEQVKGILWRLRDEVPGIAVRSTLIVGFPGESDADFAELRAFVTEFRFERLGVFAYSREEGTPAHDLPNQVPPQVAQARHRELMAVQEPIMLAHQRARIGTVIEVLIDGRDPEREGWIGRGASDAPEVDTVVRLSGQGLSAGELRAVRIVALDGCDLRGELAEVRAGGGVP
jgi:ribosomal protein S12 methylthiotransferase